jgi:hypothetical protein
VWVRLQVRVRVQAQAQAVRGQLEYQRHHSAFVTYAASFLL